MSTSTQSLIERIYEASVAPEQWSDLLQDVSSLAGASRAAMFVTTSKSHRFWTAPRDQKDIYDEWFNAGWPGRNVYAERAATSGLRRFFGELDLFTPDELDQDPMYRQFIRPNGFGWCAAAFFNLPTGHKVSLRFERAFEQGPVTAEELRRLDPLRAHFARGALLFSHLGHQRSRSTLEVLQRIDVPAAITSLSGHLVVANSAFDECRTQVATTAWNRLIFADIHAQEGFRRGLDAFRQTAYAHSPNSIRVPATVDRPSGVAYLMPVLGSARDIFGSDSAVLMMPSAVQRSPKAPLVRRLFEAPAEPRCYVPGHLFPRLAVTLHAARAVVDAGLGRAGRQYSRPVT